MHTKILLNSILVPFTMLSLLIAQPSEALRTPVPEWNEYSYTEREVSVEDAADQVNKHKGPHSVRYSYVDLKIARAKKNPKLFANGQFNTKAVMGMNKKVMNSVQDSNPFAFMDSSSMLSGFRKSGQDSSNKTGSDKKNVAKSSSSKSNTSTSSGNKTSKTGRTFTADDALDDAQGFMAGGLDLMNAVMSPFAMMDEEVSS